jgi:hypothetical protein
MVKRSSFAANNTSINEIITHKFLRAFGVIIQLLGNLNDLGSSIAFNGDLVLSLIM